MDILWDCHKKLFIVGINKFPILKVIHNKNLLGWKIILIYDYHYKIPRKIWKIRNYSCKNRNFDSVNISDFSITEVLVDSNIGIESDFECTDFMTENIEKTEKAELFHPKTENKIILQWLRKLEIQYKSGNKIQGPESGMKTQDSTSVKLTIIDFKDEWEMEFCS